MNRKVLVVDDDITHLKMIELALTEAGYDVTLAQNGKDAIRYTYDLHPDVIVLDIMMPGMDGWEVCQRIRSICSTPILMLTSKVSQAAELRSLALGADDYITKPCDLDILKARLQALLRRAAPPDAASWQTQYSDDALSIDLTNGSVAKRGISIELTPTESRILMYLVSNRGRIVPHHELLTNIWGADYATEMSYLSVYIRYLRRKIEDDPNNPYYIRTRWGMGYYFAGEGCVKNANH